MRRMRRIKKQETENQVTGEIIGGLGNQLFIIFTVISYGIDNNLKWYFVNNERKRKVYWGENIYKNVPKRDSIKGYIYSEPNHCYNKIPLCKNLTLRGYFQSYKYFDHNIEKIVELLEFNKIRTEIADKYNNFLTNDGFIHFRLGDYKNLSMHPVCDYKYYYNALSKITDKKIKLLYFFEEEDTLIVEEKINKLSNDFPHIEFSPIDTSISDYEQVFIMSHLKYCVMANSTFSWWGAYLNTRKDKKVFYPEKWFSGSLKNLDVSSKCPLEWEKII